MNENEVQVQADELETFRALLEANLQEHLCRFLGTLVESHTYRRHVSIMLGDKYVRLVVSDRMIVDGGNFNIGDDLNRSAYGFIDPANGNILKADGWKRPAPQPRGNIRHGDASNWWNGAVGPYGVASMARLKVARKHKLAEVSEEIKNVPAAPVGGEPFPRFKRVMTTFGYDAMVQEVVNCDLGLEDRERLLGWLEQHSTPAL
jgi:hypothetical protein